MPTLKEILLVPGNRPKVIADCTKLIDEEVDSKGGLSGLAIKAAYAVVKAVKPGFITEAVDHMLDDFVGQAGAVLGGRAGEERAGRRADERARRRRSPTRCCAISDARAARAKNQGVKKAYEKLRPTGKKHVEAAVPRLGRLIAKYTSAAATASTAAPPAP